MIKYNPQELSGIYCQMTIRKHSLKNQCTCNISFVSWGTTVTMREPLSTFRRDSPLGTWLLLRPACNAKDTTDQDLRITVTTSYFPLTAAETARYPKEKEAINNEAGLLCHSASRPSAFRINKFIPGSCPLLQSPHAWCTNNFSADMEASGRTGQFLSVLALSIHYNHISQRVHFRVRSKENKWATSFLVTELCARTHIHIGEGVRGIEEKLQPISYKPQDRVLQMYNGGWPQRLRISPVCHLHSNSK